MLDNFFSVFTQVVVLFFLIFVGFLCGKLKFLSDNSAKALTDLVLYFATPCMIVKSYLIDFKKELLTDMAVSIVLSLLIHIVFILLATVLFRKDNKQIFRFATVFSNAGYMALPLQYAVLGDIGVFLGAGYVAVFNIVLWTYGVLCMQKQGEKFSIKKAFLNPGVISVFVGILIFIFKIPLPEILTSAITHMANLNTPLPMIIIGFYLSNIKLGELLNGKTCMLCAVRLLFFPAIVLFLMYLFGVRGNMLYSMVIAASAPTAAATTMFSVKYGHNPKISVSVVSLTTLLSLISMPLLVAFAMLIG